MITKHYCKSIVRAALLLALTTCVTGLAPAFSTSARADYSINDVSGNYVGLGNGWTSNGTNANTNQAVPLSYVNLVTFTPANSTFHMHIIAREFGINHVVDVDGTYTVGPDGHGTMTWLSQLGNTKRYDFYIVNGGAELKYNATDPPGTVIISDSGTMTKQ